MSLNISVNDVLSSVAGFISETIEAEKLKYNESDNPTELLQVKSLIADLGFQVDFSLMSSVTEVQEIYDMYRNKLADESNIEIRTLLKLANHIHNYLNDNYVTDVINPWSKYIDRLAALISLHRNVEHVSTCQDESILSGMDHREWLKLLNNNPWLVAAVSIQYIPSYYNMVILTDLTTALPIGDNSETQHTR